MVIGWPLTAVTVVGNGLVIYLITTRRKLKTTTNWFVLSLSVADFGVGAVYFPRFSICQINSESGCLDTLVITGYSLGIFFIYGSMTNLFALTLDRYVAIVKPLRYIPVMTTRRIAQLVAAAWAVAATLSVSFLLIFLQSFTQEAQDILKKITCIGCTFLGVGVGVFLVFASIEVFRIARRMARRSTALVSQLHFNYRIHHKVLEPREVAVSKMIGTLVAFFVASSLLDVYITSCWCVGLCSEPTETLKVVQVLLIVANSAANPVVYAFFKREFRKELVLLLRRSIMKRVCR